VKAEVISLRPYTCKTFFKTDSVDQSLSDLHEATNGFEYIYTWTSQPVKTKYFRDCAEILKHDNTSKSGTYGIAVNGVCSFQVYCDMTTDGGGWTVFQRRKDGSVNFYRNWKEYSTGFGNPSGEFYLGNDRIGELTAAKSYKLRIDLGDWSGNYRYAEYGEFKIGNAADKYRLTLGDYKGDAGDSLTYHKGLQFSTYDQDNDDWSGVDCAEKYRGAWWYNACHLSNLNGEYNNTAHGQGVNWMNWLDNTYSLRFTEMKIRPVTF